MRRNCKPCEKMLSKSAVLLRLSYCCEISGATDGKNPCYSRNFKNFGLVYIKYSRELIEKEGNRQVL